MLAASPSCRPMCVGGRPGRIWCAKHWARTNRMRLAIVRSGAQIAWIACVSAGDWINGSSGLKFRMIPTGGREHVVSAVCPRFLSTSLIPVSHDSWSMTEGGARLHCRYDSIQSCCKDVSPPKATGRATTRISAPRPLGVSRATCTTAGCRSKWHLSFSFRQRPHSGLTSSHFTCLSLHHD